MQTTQVKGNSFSLLRLLSFLLWLAFAASAMHNIFGAWLPIPVITAGCSAQLLERIMRWNGVYALELAPGLRATAIFCIVAAGFTGYVFGDLNFNHIGEI